MMREPVAVLEPLAGSRCSQGSYFSMTWMESAMRSSLNFEQSAVGSRKAGPNSVFSGLGEVGL